MTLDLVQLIEDWDCPNGDVSARLVAGRNAEELLQLRIELGLMQMVLNGRPDGERYHGMPSALAHIEHELRIAGEGVTPSDWQQLLRELNQFNYRRLAFASVAEQACSAQNTPLAIRALTGAVRDIGTCVAIIQLIAARKSESLPVDDVGLHPTLVFNRGRLLAQLRVVQGRFEEAVEAVERGADALRETLLSVGFDDAGAERDAGVEHLKDLSKRLRNDYDVTSTLRERLDLAIENENFDEAATLRDELEQHEARTGTDEFSPLREV